MLARVFLQAISHDLKPREPVHRTSPSSSLSKIGKLHGHLTVIPVFSSPSGCRGRTTHVLPGAVRGLCLGPDLDLTVQEATIPLA
eukprot:4525004-Pyramimonas_sp.AAC.1